jgi:hypothetical protein
MQKVAENGTVTGLFREENLTLPSGETGICNDHRQRTDPQRMNGNLFRHL